MCLETCQVPKLKDNVVKIYKNCGLSITSRTNLKIVDYLNVTFDLQSNSHKPYRKPDNLIEYIHKHSNHPQGLTNCMHGDKCAHNVHAKRFLRAQNYMHVNQSKHLKVALQCYLRKLFFCISKQIIFRTIRSDPCSLFQLRSYYIVIFNVM